MTEILHHVRRLLCRPFPLLFAAALRCAPEAGPDTEAPPAVESAALTESVSTLTLNLKDFGARCDGTVNSADREAFRSAFSRLTSAGGGTLLVPAGHCRVSVNTVVKWLIIPSNVTIRGVAGASRISLDTDTTNMGEGRALFGIGKQNITLEDLELLGATGRNSVLIYLPPTTNFTMRRVILDGRMTGTERETHGVNIVAGAQGEPHVNLRWEQCTFRNLNMGLFQASGLLTDISGIVVTGSTFEGNFEDDLEFNAPDGRMRDVEVSHSTFRNNRGSDASGGFGVGLANVQDVEIVGNTFDGYVYEPIHIEDRSGNVLVEGNTFTRGYTSNDLRSTWRSHVFIVYKSHDITVRGNHFDMSANTLPIQAVYASPGTANWEDIPRNLVLEHNTFVPGLHGQRFLVSGMPGFVEQDNRVYVSDMPWTSAVNGTGMGPVERDRSNGDRGATDGNPITLNGVTYSKGVGVHAISKIVIPLNGKYSRFKSHLGVDDEMGSAGSVVFSVVVDGQELFTSGTLRGGSSTQAVDVSVAGKMELQLLVGNAGDGGTCDHADWADARLD